MSGAYLAVDAGGTQTRASVRASSGRAGAGTAGPANWTTMGPEPCSAAIRDAARQALREAALDAEQIAIACIALAGYYPPWHESEARAALAAVLPSPQLLLVPDLVAAWAGATGGAPGIVLAAGTGAVAYGRDERGNDVRAGGWGPLIGDEGGGYWVGREVLRAVSRALDGRGPATSLSEAVYRHGIGSEVNHSILAGGSTPQPTGQEESLRAVYRDGWSRERVAALCIAAARHAADGDRVAGSILERAAGELGSLIVAVAHRLGRTSTPLPVFATGGLTNAGPALWGPLKRWLSIMLPAATWKSPLGSPLEGALWLARQEVEE